jgi:hypothetical protein
MLSVDNLASKSEENAGPAVHVKDAAKPAELTFRMPSSYVYLGGELSFSPIVGEGGSVAVSFSDNNGLDWKEITRVSTSGAQKVDLKPLVFRRYDYRLKFMLSGKGTGLDAVKVTHDIQNSQRALPGLDKGDNHIHFAAGAQEGTITIQGAINRSAGKNLHYSDFHPTLAGVDPKMLLLKGVKGEVTFPIATPGDIARLRIGAHYRARDARDGWAVEASFDAGKTWSPIGELEGPHGGNSKYFVFSTIPASSRAALIRFSGRQRNTTLLLDVRIDADFHEPHGGFSPVKVTYAWDENGQPKQDVHIAKQADENYTLHCDSKPVMKSIAVELQ